jgi:Ca2+-binding RTX toxin-like protein
MRKLVIMLGLAMLLVMVAAGAAMAVTKTCGDNLPCEGTNNDDVLHERDGTVKDVIYGFDGNDVLDANNFFKERDRLYGGAQGDKLLANDNDGRDVLRGGAGRDRCYGDPGDRFVNCEVERRLAPTAAAQDF